MNHGISAETFHRARKELHHEGMIEPFQVDLGGGKHWRWKVNTTLNFNTTLNLPTTPDDKERGGDQPA